MHRKPFRHGFLLGLAIAALLATGLRAPEDDVLKTLYRAHPRLYVREGDLARLKDLVRSDPRACAWYERLERDAAKMIAEPPAEHKLIGPRLLAQSRAALRRVSTLAVLYRLDGDRAKAERARREMLTVAAFPDWNPSHFLDTAEMTHAMAVGYDWLYSDLTPEERTIIRRAIVEKGLKAGLQAYRQGAWWTKAHNNWSQVCNGGMTLGALAIADEEPDLAREIITRARASIANAMERFAPDGGWEEGPGYWNYATEYTVFYLTALESALGSDFGYKAMPGFSETGLFRIRSVGPLGLTFNFADASARAGTAAQMFWLAREFRRPLYALDESLTVDNHPNIFHMVWVTDVPAGATLGDLPLDAAFRGIDVAFFRSAWNDTRALFVGFKGGDNRANHSHLDLGTFVLDALGERWADDLGPDDYNLPGYFGNLRWTYYRLRTEGHNTLTLDEENQNPTAKAPLVGFLSTPERALAVADLSEAYRPKADRILRGVAVLKRRAVLVQDEIEAPRPLEAVWNFHTRARIELHGASATLKLGQAQIEAHILSPKGANFGVISANPPPPQGQQPDMHNLVIRLPGVTRARIAVLLAPLDFSPRVTLDPLAAWIAASQQGAGRPENPNP